MERVSTYLTPILANDTLRETAYRRNLLRKLDEVFDADRISIAERGIGGIKSVQPESGEIVYVMSSRSCMGSGPDLRIGEGVEQLFRDSKIQEQLQQQQERKERQKQARLQAKLQAEERNKHFFIKVISYGRFEEVVEIVKGMEPQNFDLKAGDSIYFRKSWVSVPRDATYQISENGVCCLDFS
jgi:hypothetical protein